MIRRALYASGTVFVGIALSCGTADPAAAPDSGAGNGASNQSGSANGGSGDTLTGSRSTSGASSAASGAGVDQGSTGSSSAGDSSGSSTGQSPGSGSNEGSTGSSSGQGASSGQGSSGSATGQGSTGSSSGQGSTGSSSGQGSSGANSGSGSSSGSSGKGSSGSGSAGSSGSTSGQMASGSSSGSTSGPPCKWSGGPNSSNGELTCYWFGQGTAQGHGCSSYKTYCGYCGSESGNKGGGTCPSGISNSVQNMSTQYFAAFPVGTFGGGAFCGLCLDITYQSKTITATVIDECATCPTNGHIDLSLSAAAALGLGQNGSVGDAKNGVSWHAVNCPVMGNIVAEYNNGYTGQVYFQNVAFPVASATAGGYKASLSDGFWDFKTTVGGQSVTLTDTVGHTITGMLPASSSGSIGTQFPASCQ